MRKHIKTDHITMGVCYYPEHWDKSLWREDLRRMHKLGIEVIRIAEFAWNKFEPTEGNFDFTFFDEFMDLALEENIKVIFCTPTATPPVWLSEKYPEILNADIDGNLIYHGTRRHYNLNSEKYRFFTQRIVEKLAQHYSKYENIVAWQLDNEINCECDRYYSESDHAAFRRYLQNKFKTLDELNKAAGTTFWNQTYTDWSEVHLTRRTNACGLTNPHMMLLEKRFISDTVISYFKLQADIIRKYSHAPITTNGLFGHIDYHRLIDEVLDFITYDNYPNFAYEINLDPTKGNGMRDRNSSFNLMRTRSISPIFGIMEQQSGPSGWTTTMMQSAPKPNQVKLWTMQAIAHGADFVSYFRWRTCSFGTEIYWHGIYNYDNLPNRRSREIESTSAEIKCLEDVCGREYVAEAAILCDYDNSWDGEADVWHSKPEQISNDGWFRAFQKKHIPCDLVNINDDTSPDELKKYKLLVYPHPTILTKERADILKAYAENGGTVIFGCRTGYKDINGICPMMQMPGYAAELCGAVVEEFTFISPYDSAPHVTIGGNRVQAVCFNDVLSVTDGEEIAVFEDSYYKGKPALVCKKHGGGRFYYFGAAFSEDAARALIALCGLRAPMNLDEKIALPEDIELAIRGDSIFLLNYDDEVKTIKCSASFKNTLDGRIFENEIVIQPFGSVVLKEI